MTGTCRILLVAPHAFNGDRRRHLGQDDHHTGKLSRDMAEQFGFYAVINERYKRVNALNQVDIDQGFIDCNRMDQVKAHLKEQFLDRIVQYTHEIAAKGYGDPLVIHIHGANDSSFDTYTSTFKGLGTPSILIGHGQGMPGRSRLTATEALVDLLITSLAGQNGTGMQAVKTAPNYTNYCGRGPNNLNQLFRGRAHCDPTVQSIQLEIKRAYRAARRLAQTTQILGSALSKLAHANIDAKRN
ncbi:MAG: hypothetical protein R6U38_10380 [Desulfatiglandaceae bacterium]